MASTVTTTKMTAVMPRTKYERSRISNAGVETGLKMLGVRVGTPFRPNRPASPARPAYSSRSSRPIPLLREPARRDYHESPHRVPPSRRRLPGAPPPARGCGAGAAGRRPSLLGKPLEGVHQDEDGGGLPQPAEPLGVNRPDRPRPVDPGQRAVGDQAERRVVAPDHEAVRL